MPSFDRQWKSYITFSPRDWTWKVIYRTKDSVILLTERDYLYIDENSQLKERITSMQSAAKHLEEVTMNMECIMYYVVESVCVHVYIYRSTGSRCPRQ